ncbi:MAG: tRNA 2-thiocytidine(32) synthetase TtcA [Deltaproteobacteria bacterium]|nr:tRNA 2-thiocytidine(32) synthetase TtcA [Deltaproteobacteria bacterium]
MNERAKETKLYHHLKKWLERAALEYAMIQPGDKLLVGVSGGSDSLALLDLLNTKMIFLPPFSIVAVHLDLGFDASGEDMRTLENFFREQNCDYVVETTDIGPYAHDERNKKNPCFLCSMKRKKRLVEIAEERGCNKIALGHHKDDVVETLLLNLLYAREISTMHPNQSIFSGRFHIIRPFVHIREELLKKYARERDFPVAENRCPTSLTSKRRHIKNLLDTLEVDNKDVRENIFRAMARVKLDYLLNQADRKSGS